MYYTNLILLTLLSTFLVPVLSEYHLIQLPNGVINGTDQESYTGKLFYKFMKIPYAAPPVGELRFKAPVLPDNWNNVLDATNLDIICYQTTNNVPEESEDCLYINVYTPELPSEGNNVSIPVYVYIHGGGFVEGNSMQDKRGPEYLIDHDVVIVTFNYRLGPFGFLSTGDSVIPGNAGLKDQFLALKWVHDNIRLFGGDPDKITINGESAGGSSVSYHLLNNKTQGLYRAAMLESGSALSPWSLERNPKMYAIELVRNIINDTVRDSDDLLEILQNLSADDIDRVSSTLGNWVPTTEVESEDAYITEKSYVKLKNGDFVKVPVLMGINSEERLYLAENLDTLKRLGESYDQNLSSLVPDDMRVDDLDEEEEIGEQIRRIYCGNGTFADNLVAVVKYNSDNELARGPIRDANFQSQQTPVYFYIFSYDGPIGNVSIVLEGADRVAHAEELRYIWRTTIPYYDNSDLSQYPAEDTLEQHRMLELWSNFVKYLNPTPEPSELLQNVIWPTATSGGSGNFLYLDIGENLEVKNQPKGDYYRGWVEIYDSLGYDDFDTY